MKRKQIVGRILTDELYPKGGPGWYWVIHTDYKGVGYIECNKLYATRASAKRAAMQAAELFGISIEA